MSPSTRGHQEELRKTHDLSAISCHTAHLFPAHLGDNAVIVTSIASNPMDGDKMDMKDLEPYGELPTINILFDWCPPGESNANLMTT